MLTPKRKILIISSADPLKGPGVLAIDMYKALKAADVEVDLLTQYPVDEHPEYLYVEKKNNLISRIKKTLLHLLLRHVHRGYCFFYRKEKHPPVSAKKIVTKITKPYDMVCVLFWQGLLSFETIDAIYDKLKCKIAFRCVDYSPMSGGCHFTCECERYQIGCGECPAFDSHDKNDFTAWNVQYRKNIYDKVKPVVFGNYYMNQFFAKSFLLKNVNRVISWPVIDTETFKPLDCTLLRRKYLKKDKDCFVIFFGCQSLSDPRKGMDKLAKALKLFATHLTVEQRNNVLLIVAGKNYSKIEHLMPFVSKDFGYVDGQILPELYSMADVFLCPSVHDAGPMMVNQSLCCGTPVVGFEMGACLQAVKNCGTGYCAKVGDIKDFAKGINWIYQLTNSERVQLRLHCRNFGVEHHSYSSFSKQLLKLL